MSAVNEAEKLEDKIADLERELAEAVKRDDVLSLRNEVNCRVDHGAESGGHLDYVLKRLDKMLAPAGAKEGKERGE